MISVIICSIDAAKYEKVTRNYTSLLQGEPFEIIGIHDAVSLCEGYNRGIEQSNGSILIFSHDDIEILSADFASRLKWYLQDHDVLGVAGTSLLIDGNWGGAGQPHIHGTVAHCNKETGQFEVTRYGDTALDGKNTRYIENIQAMDGVFFAANSKVARQVGFDEKTFDGFHCYDLDFTYSAYLAGYRLVVSNDIAIIHYSSGQFGDEWERYRDRFREKYQANLLHSRSRHPLFTPVQAGTRDEVIRFYQDALIPDHTAPSTDTA